MRKVNINIEVELNESSLPEHIKWTSDDPPSNGIPAEAKAFFLTVFDKERLETLRIDIWNQKFEVGEINRMMYYTFKGLAETYHRATGEDQLANDIARFSQYFGEETGVVTRPDHEQQ